MKTSESLGLDSDYVNGCRERCGGVNFRYYSENGSEGLLEMVVNREVL